MGTNGSLLTIASSNVTINSLNETITVANIIATSVDDLYLYVTLLGPDLAVNNSALSVIISKTGISLPTVEFRYMEFDESVEWRYRDNSWNDMTPYNGLTETKILEAYTNNQPKNMIAFRVNEPNKSFYIANIADAVEGTTCISLYQTGSDKTSESGNLGDGYINAGIWTGGTWYIGWGSEHKASYSLNYIYFVRHWGDHNKVGKITFSIS